MSRGPNISHEDREKIQQMLIDGYETREISDTVGRSMAIIQTMKRRMIMSGLLEEPDKSGETLTALGIWLHKNWHFKKENPVKTVSESGYRVVRKGERGHLRTPYRPDGIFK